MSNMAANMILQMRFCIEKRHLIETGRPITTAIFYADPYLRYIERMDGPEMMPKEECSPREIEIISDIVDNRAYTLPFVTDEICRLDRSVDWRKVLVLAGADEHVMDSFNEWEAFQMNMNNGLGVHPDDQVKYKKEEQ